MNKTFWFLFLALTTSAFSQNKEKEIFVKFIDQPILIDGDLSENKCEEAFKAADFQQYFPSDSILAKQKTSIKMLYDQVNLYLGVKVYTSGNDFIIPSLQRDFRAGNNDNISFIFDTFNDGTNAFLFGINPLGVRREALISNGGSDLNGFTTSWDVKWRGETKINEGYYTVEMAIPLTSMKFKEGETKWRFNSYRFDMQENETSTYTNIPQNKLIFNLAFMEDMVFEKPNGKSRTPLALIPYVNGISQRDFTIADSDAQYKIGGDAKLAIGNGMNLDLTLNPDFSNVEVDNVVTNLTRFEISLPERRQFFIDNNDLFGTFGNERDSNPFFSRRIGLAKNKDGKTIENRIIGGMRISGKLNDKLRVGVLSIQTESDLENGIPSNNNSMIALQQKVFSRSNIAAFIINRETSEAENTDYEKYNRVIGIDYNLASADNTYVGKFYTHKSLSPNDTDGNLSVGTNLQYNTRTWSGFLDAIYIDEEFTSDLGFIPRKGILKWGGKIGYRIWPKKGIFNSKSFDTFQSYTHLSSLDYTQTDYLRNFGYEGRLNNQGQIELSVNNRYTFLTDEFSPTRQDDANPLPANSDYNYTSVRFQFQSDRRKLFSYNLQTDIGEFFNGTKSSFQTRLNFRVQPKLNEGLNSNIDRIDLPEDFGNATIVLISPRIDYTFNRSLFWSTLIQYSNQRDNLGINSRLQWRFAPLSDLFLVYTDNYFVNSFSPRGRSINLKFTYWLNI